MTITEKVSYIKGLADGLVLDENNKHDKILKAIIDVLEDIANNLADVEDFCDELCEQIDAVDEDLSAVEDYVYDDDDDDCDCDDCDCGCGCCGDDDDDEDDDDLYEVTCPNCNDVIYLDADTLAEEGIACPNCGTNLEFDFDGDCDCDDCDNDE